MTEENAQTDGQTPDGNQGAGRSDENAAVYYPEKYKSRDDELAAIKADRTRSKILQSVLGDDVDEDRLKRLLQSNQIVESLEAKFKLDDQGKVRAGLEELLQYFEHDAAAYLKGETQVPDDKTNKSGDDDLKFDDEDLVSGKQVNKLVGQLQAEIKAQRAEAEKQLKELRAELNPVFDGQRRSSLREKYGDLADDAELVKIRSELDTQFNKGDLSADDIALYAAVGRAATSGKLSDNLAKTIGASIKRFEKERTVRNKTEPAGAPGGGGARKPTAEEIYRKALQTVTGVKPE